MKKIPTTFVFFLFFLPLFSQIRVSLGDSMDSISISAFLDADTLRHERKGHALYSWKSASFEAHIVQLTKDFFFLYKYKDGSYIQGRIEEFNISSCEISLKISGFFGEANVKEECGVLLRIYDKEKLLVSHDYYFSFSDVVFKGNVNQYLPHRFFKLKK